MWSTLLQLLGTPLAGSVLGLVGLLVTFCGFGLTIYGLHKAKSAAESAREAAELTRGEMNRFEVATRIAAAGSAMDEVKRLVRRDAWQMLPDRFSAIRKELVFIHRWCVDSGASFELDHGTGLQAAIQQFSTLEEESVKVSLNQKKAPSAAKTCTVIAAQADKLQSLMGSVASLSPVSSNVEQ